ncbi:MAG TPA: ATP-binding protein [Candidatus Sulfomarinibacteraceae bacterium]|nr:ATP-binding protein [Candidatus Sulfomarinibacteraceae bacterium]
MSWHRRLRWRLIGAQFLVVAVGVGMMMLATRVIILSVAPDVIRPNLLALIENPTLLSDVENSLLLGFRDAVLLSVLVAAGAAAIAGVVSSVVLWRIIIAPLHEVARSSRRIADGRYGDRVDVPEHSGEAMIQLVTSFNQMAQELESVERQRVDLLANISHELRTPLSGLRGYLEGLMDGLFPANEETFAWMSQEVDRLRRLVDDIQNLSRVEAGQFSLELEPFELQGVARRIHAQLQPQAQAKGVELLLETAHMPIEAYADADRAAQVMINIVGNAIRYTPEGGRVTLSIAVDDGCARVSVTDTGVGIPEEALPYVFERFYRVDRSRARSSGGSGIGLTISRHLVWAMGGDLTVTSEGEGQGSIFSFTLPLHAS